MIPRLLRPVGGVTIAAACVVAAIEARPPATPRQTPPGQTAPVTVLRAPPQGRGGSAAPITWDFETGNLAGWQPSGTAFANQPTFGDNASVRNSGPANAQGQYWIGTFESYHGPGRGYPGGYQGDGPQGALTSSAFTIPPSLTFRIGGGSTFQTRVELLVFEQIEGESRVMWASGKDVETMQDVSWDLTPWAGRQGRVRIVDAASGAWGHINVDYFRFGRPNRGLNVAVNPNLVGGERELESKQPVVKMVTVPDLFGSTEQEARNRLDKAGLNVGEVTKAEANSRPFTVFKQDHAAGSSAARGTPVGFVLAVPITVVPPGPGRRGGVAEPPVKTVTVPDLFGNTDLMARARLALAGLNVGAVSRAETNARPGTVFKQDHAPGSEAIRGTAVGYVLATPISVPVPPVKTAPVTVPDLSGRTEQEARDLLSKAGLGVGAITKAETSSKPDTVFEQDHAGGTQAIAGTVVGFVLAIPITVVVPSVVGNTESDAATILRNRNLQPGTIQRQQSRSPRGQVIAQAIAPGVRIPSGSTVGFTIASPIIVRVPSLRRSTQADAVELLKRAELTVGNVTSEESREPSGSVISQRPAAFTDVEIGTPVAFVIATPITVEVPQLVKGSDGDARALLSKRELAVGKVTSAESRETPGTVLSQRPVAGTRVTIGTVVDFETAEPVTVLVPDVVARTEADARIALSDAELRIGTTKVEEARVAPGSVIRQSIATGTRVIIGTTVDLVTATAVTVLVPRMMGTKEAEARQALASAELLAGVQYQESAAERDTVLGQSIDAATRVPIGTVVNIIVAAIETVPMPSVIGMTIEQARQALIAGRLTVGDVPVRAVRAQSRNMVLEQSFAAGARIPVATAVVLTVSTPEMVVVPLLRGRWRDDAFRAIESAGLTFGPVALRFSLSAGGTIVGQQMEQGARVEFGTPIGIDEARPRYIWMVPTVTVIAAVAGLIRIRSRRVTEALARSLSDTPKPVPPIDVSAKANIHMGDATVSRDAGRAIRLEVRITPIAGTGSQDVTSTSGSFISSERRPSEDEAQNNEGTS